LANNTGGITLEMTPIGGQAELAAEGMAYRSSGYQTIMRSASQQFVQNAVGNVRIVFSARAAPDSIYFTTEWQALLNNPNVTGVTFIYIP